MEHSDGRHPAVSQGAGYLYKIGNLQLANNVFLAPMAGITDRSFRQICREMGAGLTYSEMVSGKSIQFNNVKHLLDSSEHEQPWAVQLFGREPDILADAARRLSAEISADAARRLSTDSDFAHKADIIDINMGCPAPKIVKNGEGCALMKEPALAAKIISTVVSAVDVPVTIKIRKGFTEKESNAVEIAKIAQESGASAITVHGRTRDQFYSGRADWDAIAAVKAAVSIPVIANGDVDSPDAARAILSHTNCDGIMIARAACGNPWLFEQILTDAPPPTWTEKMATALRHTRMVIEHKGEHIGILEMRKHISWYIKGLKSATVLRTMVNKANTYDDIEKLLTTIQVNDIIP